MNIRCDIQTKILVKYVLCFFCCFFSSFVCAQTITELQNSANNGDALAQCRLGALYYLGKGVMQDYSEAYKWSKKAADQGYSRAQFYVGVLYENGEGVSQDYSEAYKWYKKAAEQGNASAQNNLGLLYKKGEGVSQDYSEAYKWFNKAAAQGHAEAKEQLERLELLSDFGTINLDFSIYHDMMLSKMLEYPMGCVDSDMKDGTYEFVKSETSKLFKLDDCSDNKQKVFYIREEDNDNCQSFNYHNMKFDEMRFDVSSEKRSVKYQFVLKKSNNMTFDNALSFYDLVSKDFNAMGIPMSYQKWANQYILYLGNVKVDNVEYKMSLEEYGSKAWAIIIWKIMY